MFCVTNLGRCDEKWYSKHCIKGVLLLCREYSRLFTFSGPVLRKGELGVTNHCYIVILLQFSSLVAASV